MKKIFRVLFLVFIILSAKPSLGQTKLYRSVNISNIIGVNCLTFEFSYDLNNKCVNNINIINNTIDSCEFTYEIVVNDETIHSDRIILSPCDNLFLNDAFISCDFRYYLPQIFTWKHE